MGPPQLRLFDEATANGPLSIEDLFHQHYRSTGKSRKTTAQIGLTLSRVADFVSHLRTLSARNDLPVIAWRPAGEVLTVEDLCDEFLESFLTWRTRQVKAETANKDFRHIRLLWRLALLKELATRPFRLKPLPEAKRFKRCWSPEEVKKILAACAGETELFLSVPAVLFWRALILLLYDTGLRVDALLSTTWRQVELQPERALLWVSAEHQKQHADQVFELTHSFAAIKALADHLGAGRALDKPILDWPYDANQESWPSLLLRLKRILRRAGLPFSRDDLFHRLRRTYGTYKFAAEGITATQEALGHSTPRVTWRYVDPTKGGRAVSGRCLPSVE